MRVPGRSKLGGLSGGLDARFWRLWSASATSNVADGSVRVALPLLAVALTDEPALVAGVVAAQSLPWLVFALVAGALVDRWDRRHIMIVGQVARSALLAGLAFTVFVGAASIWLLYVVAFALGMIETLFDTAAQSMLPNLVARDRLSTANGRLLAVEQAMNQFIGPPIGGLLAAAGLAVAFGAAAAGYLGAALLLLALAGSFRAVSATPRRALRREIGEGLTYVIGHRLLRSLALVVAGLNVGNSATWGVLVLYAVSPGPMGLSEFGYGIFLAVGAIGSIIGTLIAAPLERRIGAANLLVLVTLIPASAYATFALTDEPLPIAVAFATSNASILAFNVVFVSFRQRIVPDHLLGRIVASFRTLSWGVLPLGALLGGAIAGAFGLRATFAFAAIVCVAISPARLVLTQRALSAAEAAVHAESGAQAYPPTHAAESTRPL